jgi:hypothetical protein
MNQLFEDHLHFPDDEDGLGPRNVRLLSIRSRRASASRRIFDWIFCGVATREDEEYGTSDVHGGGGTKGF